ncbi:hypothetical protein ACWDOP_02320 [Nocardia sp. NPDC003693]
MTDLVALGEITCPSGELIVVDGGYLELWSGERSPDEVQPDRFPEAVDFRITGPDAAAAARAFDRQAGTTLYDIPTHATGEFRASFEEAIRGAGLDATLTEFENRVPHRERVRRAVEAGAPGFIISGVPVITVGGVPTDRPLPVVARYAAETGWEYIRIVLADRPIASTRYLDSVAVDYARFAFADAQALNAWEHGRPLDGLADVVFWGLHEDEIATEFGATRVAIPGDEVHGWLDLPVREAYEKAVALEERRAREPQRRFAFDFRPHSHHWQVMAGVRGDAHEAATIEVAGARIMFAMTSIGDGFFPAHLELDEAGSPVGVRISIQ